MKLNPAQQKTAYRLYCLRHNVTMHQIDASAILRLCATEEYNQATTISADEHHRMRAAFARYSGEKADAIAGDETLRHKAIVYYLAEKFGFTSEDFE